MNFQSNIKIDTRKFHHSCERAPLVISLTCVCLLEDSMPTHIITIQRYFALFRASKWACFLSLHSNLDCLSNLPHQKKRAACNFSANQLKAFRREQIKSFHVRVFFVLARLVQGSVVTCLQRKASISLWFKKVKYFNILPMSRSSWFSQNLYKTHDGVVFSGSNQDGHRPAVFPNFVHQL